MSSAYCFGHWCHIQIALVRWIDRMYVRTHRTLLRTRGDVDDDDGGCIDTDRNWAGLCVLQCVNIVASVLKRAALSNSDCFAQQVRVIGRCTEVSDTFT